MPMRTTKVNLLQAIFTMAITSTFCGAADHLVGNSFWSIPPTNEFYSNWAANTSFLVNDNLVFKFDTGLSDVAQVSRSEYESCSAENSYQRVAAGPARVSLIQEGVAYFVCTFGNYCRLGQKVSVPVQRPRA